VARQKKTWRAEAQRGCWFVHHEWCLLFVSDDSASRREQKNLATGGMGVGWRDIARSRTYTSHRISRNTKKSQVGASNPNNVEIFIRRHGRINSWIAANAVPRRTLFFPFLWFIRDPFRYLSSYWLRRRFAFDWIFKDALCLSRFFRHLIISYFRGQAIVVANYRLTT